MMEKGVIGRFGKFAGVGAVATLVHYALLVACVELAAWNPVSASVAGYIAGALVNYLVNFYLTFAGRTRHGRAALRFCAVVLVGLALNAALMAVLTPLLAPYYVLAQIITTGGVLASNFILNDIWSFKRTEHANDSS
ncbi:MAG: GtrA family protein [Alphaproteobacteria bacterium]|nr:MAG: GtrA family protein [Alphaproteobacteria bacterium]